MSITGVLNTALTGLLANQTNLRVTSTNIANVNTEDYSRQVVNQETLVVAGVSLGVSVGSIERIVDRFLQAAGFNANAASFESEVRQQFHSRLQGVIGRPDSDNNIAARISQVYGTLAELALDPANSSLRQSAVSSVQDTADEVSRIAQTIQDLRGEANQQVADSVEQINAALQRIHELNPQIVRQRAVGGESGGLDNQRDKALQDLSELIDIRITSSDAGIVSVTTGSGTVLLDSTLRDLEYTASGIVTAESRLTPIQIFKLDPLSGERVGVSRDFDQDVSGGTLRGLLDMRDVDLRDLSLTLGEFAGKFVDNINTIHNAFSAVPAPNTMIGKQTAIPGFQSDSFTGEVDFVVVDADGAVVQKVSANFAALGTFFDLITAVNVGMAGAGTLLIVNGVMSFSATDPSHGVVLADNPANPSSRGGQTFSKFFGMNDLLRASVDSNHNTGVSVGASHGMTAGEQVTFEIKAENGEILKQYTYTVGGVSVGDILTNINDPTALGNFVTFSINPLGGMDIVEKPGFEGANLSIVTDTTNVFGTGVTFTQQFGIGDRYLVDRSKEVKILSNIQDQPLLLALATFDRTALVGEIALKKGDQSGAIALQGLDTTISNFAAAGQVGAVSLSLGQYAAGFLANAGLLASRATQQAEDNNALRIEIDARIGGVSGVNLDEELSDMIIFQNAYNASARLITTSQEMMDELLAVVR